MKLIARWLITALGFLAAAYFIPGITVESFYVALILAFCWGIINLLVTPIILILTLPITILTLGLFSFVVNGLLLLFLGNIIQGFAVEGFLAALLGAVVVSFANWIGNALISRV
ncbi:MAG: phage holin family protein [Patescibacteria group bacterium]